MMQYYELYNLSGHLIFKQLNKNLLIIKYITNNCIKMYLVNLPDSYPYY